MIAQEYKINIVAYIDETIHDENVSAG